MPLPRLRQISIRIVPTETGIDTRPLENYHLRHFALTTCFISHFHINKLRDS